MAAPMMPRWLDPSSAKKPWSLAADASATASWAPARDAALGHAIKVRHREFALWRTSIARSPKRRRAVLSSARTALTPSTPGMATRVTENVQRDASGTVGKWVARGKCLRGDQEAG